MHCHDNRKFGGKPVGKRTADDAGDTAPRASDDVQARAAHGTDSVVRTRDVKASFTNDGVHIARVLARVRGAVAREIESREAMRASGSGPGGETSRDARVHDRRAATRGRGDDERRCWSPERRLDGS
eukprot:31314-Pelagococcus_subviridis.AAC.10